jgi:hypothetical protein
MSFAFRQLLMQVTRHPRRIENIELLQRFMPQLQRNDEYSADWPSWTAANWEWALCLTTAWRMPNG